jgi:hypothetical protein
MYFNLSGFPFNHKTSFHPQFAAKLFLSVCWFAYIFLDRRKASLFLAFRVGELVAMLVDFIMKVLFIPYMYFYHVLLFHGAID